MKCFNGVQSKQGALVPCGQCMNCRINKGRNWSSRILMEQMATPWMSWFLTLTYDDEHVPVTPEYVPTLRKSEFQAWRKEAERKAGRFQYYAVGEYGENTLRPHYHMAVFPSFDSQVQVITDLWPYGFTSAYELIPERARYLAQYTTKKLTAHTDERLEEGQEPEFRTSSRQPAIGAAAITALVDRYSQGAGAEILESRGDVERSIRFDGRIYPIAPYILGKVRAELGIPARHEDRLCHPGYYEWHQTQEAENCPESFKGEELKRHGQKKRQKYRTVTSQV